MRSMTSETIKFGRFELCAACVEYSTVPVKYLENVQLVFQMLNFSCAEYNAFINYVCSHGPVRSFFFCTVDSNAMHRKSSIV